VALAAPQPPPPAPVYIYKPAWVANTFIVRARDEGVRDVDPLKIQKLVYHLHGWHLATTGCPAVGEQFEAWPNGPVISSLYHQFKKFKWNTITDYAQDIDPATGEFKALVVTPSDEQFRAIFDAVWQRYKGLSGPELSALTHAPDTPWSEARAKGLQYISNDRIKDYFLNLGRQTA
jgi:uncharacterized phage-associated protein